MGRPRISRAVLLGPPASGKGTLGEMLSKELGLPAVSTGAILRRERERGSEIGKEAARWTDRGRLFPDELAMRVVRGWIEENGLRFLFDGFPRTLPQATAFDSELSRRGVALDRVLSLELDPDEIRRRVLARLTCPKCGKTFSTRLDPIAPGDPCPGCKTPVERRDDESPEVLDRRLAEHKKLTEPLLEYYREQGLLLPVDASGGTQTAFAAVLRALSNP